jgi:hypothetical protein
LQSKFDTFRDVKSHELKLYCSRHELNWNKLDTSYTSVQDLTLKGH